MKEGIKVKVLCCLTGHGFYDGEIVERRVSELDDVEMLGFYSENTGTWYMKGDEYTIVDKSYAISLLSEALTSAKDQDFSNYVLTAIQVTIELAQQEVESK